MNETTHSLAPPFLGRGMTLGVRALLVATLLFAEKFVLNFFVDFDAAQSASGLGALVRDAQHVGFRFMVSFVICLALLAWVRSDSVLRELNAAARHRPLRVRWLAGHALLLPALAALSQSLYVPGALPFAVVVALWLVCALAAAAMLCLAMVPWSVLRRLARVLGVLWLYAAVAAGVAAIAMPLSQVLWQRASHATFVLVGALLAPWVSSFHADAATQVLSAGDFAVQISEVCSGLEGAGLMLAFCCAWLVYFRKDYYFPRALVLLPLGVLLVLALNVVRIAALVLIGYAGLPAVAAYGFHSQAGWIAFNAAAAALVVLSRRSTWLSRAAIASRPDHEASLAAPYLLPLLAILATGMLTIAASSGFDRLYGLRLLVGAAALAFCLPRLTALQWRFTWRGPLAGGAVFLLWILVSHWLTPRAAMPQALAAMHPAQRSAWILLRAMAAVITVPIAEELAYRGYLMRRLMTPEFQVLRFEAVRPWAAIASAVAFGALHGTMWPAGIVAGIAYAWVAVRTGRIGEAVGAHVTTNALLCACVLLAERWEFW